MRRSALLLLVEINDTNGYPARVHHPLSGEWLRSLRRMVWDGSGWVPEK